MVSSTLVACSIKNHLFSQSKDLNMRSLHEPGFNVCMLWTTRRKRMQKDITRLYRVNSSLRVFGSTQRVSRAFFSSSNTSMHKLDAEPHSMSTSGQPFRVIFGSKLAAEHLGHLARSSGIHKMLLVRDNDPSAASRAQYIEFLLMQAGIPCFQYTLKRDCATIEGVDDGVAVAQRVGANGVLAFGGGSSMDMTRAIALLISNGGSANEYMRVSIDDNLMIMC
jgi:hypothetical protein